MNKNNRHAYMIMAHHRPDLLQLLIEALDDERNDLIIHIDKKSDIKLDTLIVKKASLFFTKRIEVNWAGYTQVEAEYILMKKAIELGHHSYYHFLTGANYPLWNQDYIHSYFEKMSGYEFIGFDYGADYSLRAKYFIPFSEYGKLHGFKGKFIQFIRIFAIYIQKLVNIDRRRMNEWEFKKGCAYFSITENLVKEIIANEKNVKKALNKTISPDEVFVQTIAYNSIFKDNIYDLFDEFNGCLREFAWNEEHPGWNFSLKDMDYLLNSRKLFAMKFESDDGLSVIKNIKEARNI